MRDFPMFDTEFGVASLVLKEVPYRGDAYIVVQDTLQPEELIRECVSFCRMCGAERIYARGHESLEQYPRYCSIYQMRALGKPDDSKIGTLSPVTEETVSDWRQFLNERLRNVDNAATLEKKDERWILQSGGAYYIYSGTQLLGAGWVEDNEIKLLASARPGAGERVLHTLLSVVQNRDVTLEVASTNTRAIRLYEKAGFKTTAVTKSWYRVF